MSNIVTFAQAGLPAVSTLSTALRQAAQSAAPAAGVVIIKMDRTGHWVFGADQTEVEDDSTWAVNPFSFLHLRSDSQRQLLHGTLAAYARYGVTRFHSSVFAGQALE